MMRLSLAIVLMLATTSAYAVAPVVAIPGVLLTAVAASYYQVPKTDPALKQVRVTSMRFVNHDTVDRKVSVYLVQPGQAAANANARFKTLVINPTSAGGASPYFELDDVLLPGGSIVALADAPSVVSISANGLSYP